MQILAISGSLGARSSNKLLLEACRDVAPHNVGIKIFEGIGELPHFNPDLDRPGLEPLPPVREFRGLIAQADAILISTPEYAHGVPGSLKNALDWLVSGPEMMAKPVGVIFGSAGDADFAYSSLVEILKTMSARVIPGALLRISGVRSKFDKSGALNPSVAADLRRVIEALRSEHL